jgi:hypothetical protein
MNTEIDNTAKTSEKKRISLFEKIMNAKIFIFAALFFLTILIVGGHKLASEVYGNITGNLEDSYKPISNQDEATLALFKSKLAEDGIKPKDTELSVFGISESTFKYRWKRGDDERIYVIRRNLQGIWDAYSQ